MPYDNDDTSGHRHSLLHTVDKNLHKNITHSAQEGN